MINALFNKKIIGCVFFPFDTNEYENRTADKLILPNLTTFLKKLSKIILN